MTVMHKPFGEECRQHADLSINFCQLLMNMYEISIGFAF